ncbi:hypothetical protein GH714_029023 [Hevea brasiliensis]|uniref:Zinc finger PHD-type domain-containing protein n=1 Tax=Hevea brasiliensis TaxID=3981 RepID=A0A6A6M675_HEVBR|nr:hypothetical protein GH714_029023 [Hevea brasiliensis]
MKRELPFVVGVQSQLAGSLGLSHGLPIDTQSQQEVSEDGDCKRLKVAKINGFIVYSRVKKSRASECDKISEDVLNKRINTHEEPQFDVTNRINTSLDEDWKCPVVETVIEENQAWLELYAETNQFAMWNCPFVKMKQHFVSGVRSKMLEFCVHALSATDVERAAQYICFENGKSLLDVLNACRLSPLDSLEATIQNAISDLPKEKTFTCKRCKGTFPTIFVGKVGLLCNSCVESKESNGTPACEASIKIRTPKPAVVSKYLKSASVGVSSQNKSQWRITTKDQRLHKLVFEEGGLPDGTEVAYYARGQKLLVGYKRGFGILCCCCNCEVSPSTFEAHAGWATRKKPYAYIYTSNGVSLHELAISLSKGRKYSAKDNDDLCIVCADGGSLVLCDGCPREKFVEHNANAVAAGRISGVDPIEQITKRCIRIVRNIEAELSGCVLCRAYDFSRSGFGPRTIILCDQCEKEFHVGCLRSHKMANLKELPEGKWFCCPDCGRIHSTLQKLIIRGSEKLPISLLDVIKKKNEEKGLETINDIDVRWRILSGKIVSAETKVLLSQALAIFQECFDPIVDKTGRDLIPLMVYGKNSKGQDYEGMYCAVLVVNSFVVSAGILRIFGQEVAELPLVATSNGNHGKGYFQLLFSCIEKLLAFLNVQSLVLPAAEEAESIWTDKFGFQKIEPDQISNYRKSCCQMVTFKGTSMLQRMVPACRIVNQNAGSVGVL